jgi:hypothetical protein
VIRAVPPFIPVSTPVTEFIEATLAVLVLQVPLGVAFASVVEYPLHTTLSPVIEARPEYTVSPAIAEQPVDAVYEIVVDPNPVLVATPEV